MTAKYLGWIIEQNKQWDCYQISNPFYKYYKFD